jgi:TonB family protein
VRKAEALELKQKHSTGSGASSRGSSPGTFNYRHIFSQTIKLSANKVFAPALVCFASAIWISAILQSGLSKNLLPWFFTLSIGTFFLVSWSFRGQKMLPPRIARLIRPEENTLKSWLSLSYLVASLCLFSFFITAAPLEQPVKHVVSRQVIDIQLVSHADYENRHELLPSTEPKPSQRKRIGDAVNTVGDDNQIPKPSLQHIKPSAQSIQSPQIEKTKAIEAPKEKAVVKKPQTAEQSFFISQQAPEAQKSAPLQGLPKAFPWPQYAPRNIQFVSTHTVSVPHSPLEIQEVKPPELLEVTENDGDAGTESWQAGGRSAGGKGAHSPLTAYLREMHKKLKKAWMPTANSSRKAEILFRLTRDGGVESVKLVTSSGDRSVDQSAIEAIAAAAPFGALPKEFTAPYLDVKYTFNFHTNELTEFKSGMPFSSSEVN